MRTLTVSKGLLNPISLPGMGRSVDLPELAQADLLSIRTEYARQELFIEFEEEPGTVHQVTQMWANPHSTQVTLFIR